MSSKLIRSSQTSSTGPEPPQNLASDLKPAGDAAAKVKPCCVCKDEKAARDECMLFSNSSDPVKECESIIGKYKSCMAGFGFNLP